MASKQTKSVAKDVVVTQAFVKPVVEKTKAQKLSESAKLVRQLVKSGVSHEAYRHFNSNYKSSALSLVKKLRKMSPDNSKNVSLVQDVCYGSKVTLDLRAVEDIVDDYTAKNDLMVKFNPGKEFVLAEQIAVALEKFVGDYDKFKSVLFKG
jgi:hypothetical protein